MRFFGGGAGTDSGTSAGEVAAVAAGAASREAAVVTRTTRSPGGFTVAFTFGGAAAGLRTVSRHRFGGVPASAAGVPHTGMLRHTGVMPGVGRGPGGRRTGPVKATSSGSISGAGAGSMAIRAVTSSIIHGSI